MIEFQPWPKIARLNRACVITEKIDGTNAAVGITQDEPYVVYAQSRTRLITPDNDNFGFARWVDYYADELVEALGPGLHFGEWWGSGIQRKYGLTSGEKRFSLFNTPRYSEFDLSGVPGLGTVPVLYEGGFSTDAVDAQIELLRELGSQAAPGFMNPEGVVVFHVAAQTAFKVTLDNDEAPKGKAA